MRSVLAIGLDLGTTGARAVLTDGLGQTLAVHESSYGLLTPRPGWAEQAPEDWERAAFEALGTVAAHADDPADICAIGLTGQMHGLVLLDQRLHPLRRAIIWCDLRTMDQRRFLEQRVGAAKFIEHTGNLPLEGFQAPKLEWIREHEPELFDRIAHVLLPKDFIRLRLTNELWTDVTDASGTGYFDPRTREWSKPMIDSLEIDHGWLPGVCESTAIAGRLTQSAGDRLGLPAGIPIAGGAGDQPAGGVAARIVNDGDTVITIGTSGVVFVATNAYAASNDGTVQAGAHAIPKTWQLMGVTQAAGLSLRWLRDTFSPATSYLELVEEAQSVPAGSRGLLWLPYLQGERTPYLDANARAALVGLTAAHNRADVVRAVLEGVAFSLCDALEAIQKTGASTCSFKLAGGGARSSLWCRVIASVLDASVMVEPEGRGPAFGAALLGSVAAGEFDSVLQACEEMKIPADVVDPNTSWVQVMATTLSRYRDLYPALLATNREAAASQIDA